MTSAWVSGTRSTAAPIASYRELALLHAEDGELASALRVSELSRDRVLRARIALRSWVRQSLPDAERAQLSDWDARVQDVDDRISVTSDVITRVRLESERAILVAQRGAYLHELFERFPRATAAERPPNLDEVRDALAADTAVVSIVHSDSAWWALVVRRGLPVRFVRFADRAIGVAASAWGALLRGSAVRAWPTPGDGLVIGALRPERAAGPYLGREALGDRLSAAILAPLAAALGGARHLVVVADDELIGLPLGALPFGRGALIDRFEVSYAPSISFYLHWLRAPPRTDAGADFLGIGAVEVAPGAAPGSDDALELQVHAAADHPLLHASEELSALAALFPAARRDALTGAEASKARLRAMSRSGRLRDFRVVHFATHAWARPGQPDASAVLLSADAAAPAAERVLTAGELAGFDMGSDLLVLSACETGVGRFEHGQGLLGFAFGALAAGNRGTLLSAWPIDDDATARFMSVFYRHLLRRGAPAAALAQTQREFRAEADPRMADPRTWAPFMLYGGY